MTAGSGVKVVYVADSDVMMSDFAMIRASPDALPDVQFQFQNVTFFLNCIDWLTGNTEFIEVRKHEPIFASLRMIDAVQEQARSNVRKGSRQFQEEYDDAIRVAQEAMDQQLQNLREEVDELQEQSADGTVDRAVVQQKLQQFSMMQEREQRKLDVRRTKLERERESNIREIERKAADEVTTIQNKVKAAAVALPCIPPLIVGVIVFASRRLRERENITKSRLK